MERIETDRGEKDERRRQMRWLMELGRTVRPLAAIAIGAPLLAGILLVLQAYLLSQGLNEAIVANVSRLALAPTLMAIGCLIFTRALMLAAGDWAGGRASEAIKLRLREGLFRRLLAEQPSWTSARPSGALAGLIVDRVEAVDGFFARYLPAVTGAAFLPLAFGAAVLTVDVVVGLLFLITAPLIPFFMALVGWGAEAANRKHARAFARLSGLFADRLRGIVTLKLFGRTEAEAETIEQASEELRQRTLGVLKIAFLSSAVLEFFAALGVAGVALYVGLTYLGLIDLRVSPLTLQAGLFCLLMAPEIYLPLRQMAVHYHDRAAAQAAVAEIVELFGDLPDVSSMAPVNENRIVTQQRQPAGLTLSDVTIRAPSSTRVVLERISLSVAPGEHVAVLSESGLGKSTLLETIARLRDFDGRIQIGADDVPTMSEVQLRHDVAFIGQRPRLFHGTIAENIRLGRRDASSEDVVEAARRARVLEFTDALDDGLETMIGEGSIGLSGGEAHRVALARLFLRDPAIVLLDEPTAHLDQETEARVISSIESFCVGRTLIVATHSHNLASRMDRTLRIAGKTLLSTPFPRSSARGANKGVA